MYVHIIYYIYIYIYIRPPVPGFSSDPIQSSNLVYWRIHWEFDLYGKSVILFFVQNGYMAARQFGSVSSISVFLQDEPPPNNSSVDFKLRGRLGLWGILGDLTGSWPNINGSLTLNFERTSPCWRKCPPSRVPWNRKDPLILQDEEP